MTRSVVKRQGDPCHTLALSIIALSAKWLPMTTTETCPRSHKHHRERKCGEGREQIRDRAGMREQLIIAGFDIPRWQGLHYGARSRDR